MRRPALLSLLIVLYPILFVTPGLGQVSSSMEVGRVWRLRPKVTGGPEAHDEAKYKELERDENIVDGTKVVTGDGAGTAILLVPPVQGFVQMGSSTKLAFNQWLTEVIGGKRKLEVYVGRIFASFWSDAESANKITIRVRRGDKVVELELEGTSVYLDVAPDGSIFLMVLDGSVSVNSQSGEPVRVSAGQQTFITMGQRPTDPVPFNTRQQGRLDPRALSEVVLLEPPLIDLNDPRLNLPK